MSVVFASSGIRTYRRYNKINRLAGGEGWIPVAFPPPLALTKAFSRSGCARIFPLFSGVMRDVLSTDRRQWKAKSVLSGPIFSRPDDCAVLVFRLQFIEFS